MKSEDALKCSAEINASHVQVETSDGTVPLRGNVRSWLEREEVENAVWAAPGVTQIENRLTDQQLKSHVPLPPRSVPSLVGPDVSLKWAES